MCGSPGRARERAAGSPPPFPGFRTNGCGLPGVRVGSSAACFAPPLGTSRRPVRGYRKIGWTVGARVMIMLNLAGWVLACVEDACLRVPRSLSNLRFHHLLDGGTTGIVGTDEHGHTRSV